MFFHNANASKQLSLIGPLYDNFLFGKLGQNLLFWG
jgi:hypothetical protein